MKAFWNAADGVWGMVKSYKRFPAPSKTFGVIRASI